MHSCHFRSSPFTIDHLQPHSFSRTTSQKLKPTQTGAKLDCIHRHGQKNLLKCHNHPSAHRGCDHSTLQSSNTSRDDAPRWGAHIRIIGQEQQKLRIKPCWTSVPSVLQPQPCVRTTHHSHNLCTFGGTHSQALPRRASMRWCQSKDKHSKTLLPAQCLCGG
jgi:hypothetical protein